MSTPAQKALRELVDAYGAACMFYAQERDSEALRHCARRVDEAKAKVLAAITRDEPDALDARRLDAFTDNPRWQLDCEVLKFGKPGKWRVWSVKGNPYKSTDIRVHGEGDTPREAIDAALARDKLGMKKEG